MIEILWHGRGGQGAFTAARLLGAAASLDDGRHALAFPSFGPERRGAPMRAFTKLSDEPIGDRSAVAKADYVIYLDDTLLGEGWETELKPGGVVLVNSVRMFDDERIAALDADGISAAVLGRPIPNTVFLGALSALCDRVSVENVQEDIRQYMPAKLHAKNIAIVDAAREAMGEVQTEREVEGAHAAPAESAPSLTACGGSAQDDVVVSPRPASRIPALRSANLDPADFAHSTCFDAGYLTVKNAGWRNMRPVIDAASCTGCLQCYLYCPDGTVCRFRRLASRRKQPTLASPGTRSRGDAEGSRTEVSPRGLPAGRASPPPSPRSRTPGKRSLTHWANLRARPCSPRLPSPSTTTSARGCGVCAKACRFGAITMIPESEADAR
ncbi:MAG: 2-oxoacid:acceptor oxidoreductase family protein [Eggerthella lenta]